MNKPKIFVFMLICLCFLNFSGSSFAQTETNQAEPSYEVILQILIASNNPASKSDLPANLSETVNKFKKTFPYTEYRLISSNFQRIENKGNINYRGLLNDLSPAAGQDIISNWNLSSLKKETAAAGGNRVSFQRFSFDVKIPFTYISFNESKSSVPITNHEQIGIVLQGFNVPENTPTLIGTLAMPKADETIFFILTVKPAE